MANLANVAKGDKVIMRLFTGAFSGVKEVEKVDKNYIYFTTGKGLSKFSKKSGKMVEPAPKNERYANYIEEYDEKVAKAEFKKKNSKKEEAPAKKKKAAPKEEAAPVKKKKIAKKKKSDVEEL